MKVWAIADVHLSFGVPDKSMEVFGPSWVNYQEKLHAGWLERVHPEDLVLIPGDISWAIHLDDALVDLRWIDALPGTKVLLKGNHDFWWPSASKLENCLPPSIHFVQNSVYNWNGVSIGGSRLWDTEEFSYNALIDFQDNPRVRHKTPEELLHQKEEDERIFVKELDRLERSLKQLDPNANHRIAMTHYPPIGVELHPSRASALLERYGVRECVFGHMHNVRPGSMHLGSARGVRYLFAAADYLHFKPLEILSL